MNCSHDFQCLKNFQNIFLLEHENVRSWVYAGVIMAIMGHNHDSKN